MKGNFLNNRLLHVNDKIGEKNEGVDLADQGKTYTQSNPHTHNYAYDEIGNLISDKSEEIAEIVWNVSDKVSEVHHTSVCAKPDLKFTYDAMGQRIAKTVTNKNVTTGDKFVTTYYVRDPQGNVLAVYEHKRGESGNGTFTLAEQHLYGAGRLGMRKRDLALNVANANESTPTVTHYELTNHLGNVMAVISDEASDTNEPTVVSLSDYYPYGMTEPGRSWNAGDYRFGYTGHEKENDLADGVYTTEYRLLDTRLGRWMSVDKMAGEFAGMSPYNYCVGNPIIMMDPDGRLQRDANGKVIFIQDEDPEKWCYTGFRFPPSDNNKYTCIEEHHFDENGDVNKNLRQYLKIPSEVTKEQLSGNYIVMEFKAIKGSIMLNDGTKITAYKTPDEIIIRYSIVNQEGQIIYSYGEEKYDPTGEDFSHNCAGKFADCEYTIPSTQFTVDNLTKIEGYKKVRRPKAGDFGIYYDSKTGAVKHVEKFEEDEEGKYINTKGGTEPFIREGASGYDEAGSDSNFKDCKYMIIHKDE